MLSGVFSTLLLTETKGKTLEELSGENVAEEEEHEQIPLLHRS